MVDVFRSLSLFYCFFISYVISSISICFAPSMVYGTAQEVGWRGSKKTYVLQKGLNSNIFTYLDTGVQKTNKQTKSNSRFVQWSPKFKVVKKPVQLNLT